MPRVTTDLAQAWRCDDCHGLWLAATADEALEDTAARIDTGPERADIPLDSAGTLECPACTHHQLIRMVDVAHPEIAFESCKSCYGRYYDAGEFRDASERDWMDALLDRLFG